MPRKIPVSKVDREIASRIKEFRAQWKCTRPHLANQIGITPEEIKRIENGLVPLKYGVARKIFSYLPINPHWAATGNGLPKGYVILPTGEELKSNENALFSEVYFSALLPSFLNEDADFQMAMIMRYHRGLQNADLVKKAFRDIPEDQIGNLRNSLETFIFGFLARHPEPDLKKELQRQIWYANASQFFQAPNAERPIMENLAFLDLTDKATSDKTESVQGEWSKLKKRIQAATAKGGSKSKLASFLGVELAQLSKWLTDSNSQREPGAEYTLQMQAWVADPKRQK